MKKYLITTMLIALSSIMALAFNVTFRVDMTNAPAFTVANVNGTFNNWCGGCAAMTD
ncbi:MAG: hypothetical protein RLY35_1449, partial [Bacteroidota bacterium]